MFETSLQSIIFKKSAGWNFSKARYWMRMRKIKPLKRGHETANSIRYRIKEPSQFDRFVTVRNDDNGINFVFGIDNNDGHLYIY
jgi:hypothetical protein